MTPIRLTLALPAAALALSACVNADNDRLTIGHSVRLDAFAPPPPPAAANPSEQISAPSITSISRAEWAATPILVPVDGTTHHPIYARRTTWADQAARQRGMNPTAMNALELYQGSEKQQEYEALNNQWRAFTDVVLLAPRLIGWAPWGTRASPDEAYQRYWHPERPEGVPPPGQAPSVTP